MELQICTNKEVGVLAQMCKQLFEDENNNSVSHNIDVIKDRLESIISSQDQKAILFIENEEVAGYALINNESSPSYLVHFFITREMRRKKLGTIAFNKLIEELDIEDIDLNVLGTNKVGMKFWESLGFEVKGYLMNRYIN